MSTRFENALVGQSGGPTAAINATLAGVIRGALEAKNSGQLGTIYGMRNGIEGGLAEDFLDLGTRFSGEDGESALSRLSLTPASALGSCRKRLPDPEADPSVYERLLAIFRKWNIGYFFYIGGNDSMDTTAKMSRWFGEHAPGIRIVGVPKTIDNDLCGTDHSPGFGSAAKYIAATVREILFDTSVYTVRSVTIVEAMGRDAGWLAAASVCAGIGGYRAPDIICLPERVFDPAAFAERVRKAWETHPNVVAVVSEGIRAADGNYVGAGFQSGSVDVFGHKYLAGAGKYLEEYCRQTLGCKVRSVELNLPQRCAGHLLSGCDIRESEETGRVAVRAALRGESGVMIGVDRISDVPYRVAFCTRPASLTAGHTKEVPPEYITEDGFGVTDAFMAYVRPLIEGEIYPPFRDGLPEYFTF